MTAIEMNEDDKRGPFLVYSERKAKKKKKKSATGRKKL